ncbi:MULTISPECIES: ABC transporter ATP-binding protein [unclassified Mesorhizobium]|uniref:ABC transporter ATP-binding protein n=1 Tax=unclassified Mesorhizobium TaxID=325217 RepID=UPI000FD1BEA3|nr:MULTISPECIES: ABC transporter ATP-binding protein [unclassified Mesorhizobium]RVB78631.1 ABC transporter ATP-binding protein [Mesorhizobium sp. M6A.T.Cr.TU.014.01.1.1]RWP81178.1 MAG: ABC transporter ATP-binding protein [Mesorhizobium sp.]RWQ09102.1 MAG: ABC transporter ATP-binding protein [Mesorhizobium sp.]RWQ11918.1 MAG: ABC transporter ATP-binding protein [Mesorhizobium sp.]
MTIRPPVIEIAAAEKMFGSFQALSDISLSIEQGEIVTLLGPSGCGKTTLMRLIAGFETVTAGTVKIDGKDCADQPPERRPVNMVFQRYALFPHLDVFENVAFGLKVRGTPKAEIRERVQHMLHIVQLDSFANRYINELSGGQSQRVALARALVNGPKVLLLDEPLAALDLKIRQHMLVEMKRIHAETGATFVYVTHDQDEAMILSDRVVLMEKGRIVQIDRPEIMYAAPRSLFAAKFLGETNLFEAAMASDDASGMTAVTASGLRFHSSVVPAGELRGKVIVSIRPESFRFARDNDTTQSATGQVEDVIFIGSRSFYTIRLADGIRVRVQIQRSTRTSLPKPGEKAEVFWDSENVVILPQS